MPKSLSRIVALLLIPCLAGDALIPTCAAASGKLDAALVADPVMASAFQQSPLAHLREKVGVGESLDQPLFKEEALAAFLDFFHESFFTRLSTKSISPIREWLHRQRETSSRTAPLSGSTDDLKSNTKTSHPDLYYEVPKPQGDWFLAPQMKNMMTKKVSHADPDQRSANGPRTHDDDLTKIDNLRTTLHDLQGVLTRLYTFLEGLEWRAEGQDKKTLEEAKVQREAIQTVIQESSRWARQVDFSSRKFDPTLIGAPKQQPVNELAAAADHISRNMIDQIQVVRSFLHENAKLIKTLHEKHGGPATEKFEGTLHEIGPNIQMSAGKFPDLEHIARPPDLWRVAYPPTVNNMVKDDTNRRESVPPAAAEESSANFARTKLQAATQAYVDRLSASDDIFTRPPAAFLILGNPDLRTFLEFAERWHTLRRQKGLSIPVVLAGGIGRGTEPLRKKAIQHYQMEDGPLPENLKELAAPDLTEAAILEIIFKQEGIPPESLHKEGIPSSNTEANFVNSLPVLIEQLKNREPSSIAIVTAPWLLMRAGATARRVWEERGAPAIPQLYKTYAPRVETLSDEDLVALAGYITGYPQDYVERYPKLNSGNEFKGTLDNMDRVKSSAVLADAPQITAQDWPLQKKTSSALKDFLDVGPMRYDEATNRFVSLSPNLPTAAPLAGLSTERSEEGEKGFAPILMMTIIGAVGMGAAVIPFAHPLAGFGQALASALVGPLETLLFPIGLILVHAGPAISSAVASLMGGTLLVRHLDKALGSHPVLATAA